MKIRFGKHNQGVNVFALDYGLKGKKEISCISIRGLDKIEFPNPNKHYWFAFHLVYIWIVITLGEKHDHHPTQHPAR